MLSEHFRDMLRRFLIPVFRPIHEQLIVKNNGEHTNQEAFRKTFAEALGDGVYAV